MTVLLIRHLGICGVLKVKITEILLSFTGDCCMVIFLCKEFRTLSVHLTFTVIYLGDKYTYWHWDCQNYAAGWLDRNLCHPRHNFSWLALTYDEFSPSGAAKNKTLDKFLITFWAKSHIAYTCCILCGKLVCIQWYMIFNDDVVVQICLEKNICLPFTKLLRLLT